MYDTGLAHPATRPSTAQPSPPSPSSRHNQQPGPAARQPATHPWLRSLVAETSFRPSPKPAQPRRQRMSGHASHYRPLPAHQQAQPSVPRSGLSNVSETGLRPRLTRPFRRSLRLVSKYASLRLASGPVPQPACWRVYVSTGLRPSLASNSLPSLSPSSDPPKHSSAQPAEVPGATNTIIQLPSTTHGFAASWLRLASGPAQPATRLSQSHPSPSAYQPGLN